MRPHAPIPRVAMASANAGEAAGKAYTLEDALCMVSINCLHELLFLQQK